MLNLREIEQRMSFAIKLYDEASALERACWDMGFNEAGGEEDGHELRGAGLDHFYFEELRNGSVYFQVHVYRGPDPTGDLAEIAGNYSGEAHEAEDIFTNSGIKVQVHIHSKTTV